MELSKQFDPIKMYHIAWAETPPHELQPGKLQEYDPENNIHPDVLHMGTRRAALQIYRTTLHEYEVDPKELDPVVYGEAPYIMADPDNMMGEYLNPSHKQRNFRKRMQGVQEGLWESVPAPVLEAAGGKIIQYRNRMEDPGSISYMVPKSAIKEGRVRYKGFTPLLPDVRRKLEKEENLDQNDEED